MKNGLKVLVVILALAVVAGGVFIARGMLRKDAPAPESGSVQEPQPEQPAQTAEQPEQTAQQPAAQPEQPAQIAEQPSQTDAQTEEAAAGEEQTAEPEETQPELPHIVENEGDLEVIIPDDMDQGGL